MILTEKYIRCIVKEEKYNSFIDIVNQQARIVDHYYYLFEAKFYTPLKGPLPDYNPTITDKDKFKYRGVVRSFEVAKFKRNLATATTSIDEYEKKLLNFKNSLVDSLDKEMEKVFSLEKAYNKATQNYKEFADDTETNEIIKKYGEKLNSYKELLKNVKKMVDVVEPPKPPKPKPPVPPVTAFEPEDAKEPSVVVDPTLEDLPDLETALKSVKESLKKRDNLSLLRQQILES